MTLAIRTKGLGKTYRSGFWRIPYVGLEGLDLEVPEGAAFGFVGPNGAGKTTTIKILMGLQTATAGEAWLHDLPVRDPASRKRVGFLPERPYFYEHLSAREFLDFYARLCEVPAAERPRRIDTLLERVDLARFRDVPLGKFSKGMLQRAGLAQALVGNADLLVLDEPMSGLDPIGRVLVRDIIAEERRSGKTVFFSSHILSDIETLCDRAAILVRGKLRGQGRIADLIDDAVTSVDITVRAPEAWAPPPNAEVREHTGGRATLRFAPDDADAALDGLRAQRLEVLALSQQRRTLEQVLLDEVERASPVDAKRLGVLA